jgi:hypothetical protein
MHLSLPRTGYIYTLLFTFVAGIPYALLQFYNSVQFVNEIAFIDGKMMIRGYDFNTAWETELDIKHSKIEIKAKPGRTPKPGYFLRVTSARQVYDINKSFSWDYNALIDIFQEFRTRKGEKIILDEKFLLENIRKKAKN